MYFRTFIKHLPLKEIFIVRSKHQSNHWSVLRKKTTAIHKALDHFDDFYKQIYTKKWESIRKGLLKRQKYVVVVNNYGDVEDTVAYLESKGALNMRTLFKLEKGYINEKYEENQRVRYLEEIWKLDRQAEKTNAIDETQNVVKEDVKKEFSLEASIKDATLDESRLIDFSDGMSASILTQFIPATKIKGKEDWVAESDHFKYYDNESNFEVKIVKEYDINFPDKLDVYCFEEDNFTKFVSPKRGITGVYNYYVMDGGSILPVLALDLKPGLSMLDMCASPGGKSLVALQTLYPKFLRCNDVSYSRVERILNVLHEYFYDLNEKWISSNKIKITNDDGRSIENKDYDRILVDVPCTTDRLSVIENDNNIFKPSRVKERLKLPELQCALLVQALKIVANSGIVVYSTCSLSPIQNDGVVYMALKQISVETKREFIVKDLSPALSQVGSVYTLADKSLMKFGHLVTPSVSQNYGPTYFCKIERIK